LPQSPPRSKINNINNFVFKKTNPKVNPLVMKKCIMKLLLDLSMHNPLLPSLGADRPRPIGVREG
jgi:hypothetical protein